MAPDLATDYAPYAPYKSVQSAINRYRERGLPDPLTTAELERIGVPGSMTARTLQALRFLGLVDEGGNRLEPFERLKRATSEEYPTLLGEIVRSAYLPVFQIVDPDQDTDTALSDAFRRFEPSAQRGKMIALFRGLAEESGLISRGKPRQRGGGRRAEPVRAKAAQPKPKKEPTEAITPEPVGADAPDYRLIAAVMQQLPKEPRWTKARRDRWLQALTAAMDLMFEVEDKATEG